MRARLVAIALLVAGCGGGEMAQEVPIHHVPGPLADTWAGAGSSWHPVGGSGPAARYFTALAYDLPRHDYVLFGGQTAAGTSDETWTFDGSKWMAKAPAHKPPPRRDAAMAYDASHGVVLLYGGLVPDQSEGFEASDTWSWDGTDWTQEIERSTAPGPREGPRMVSAGNRVVLFGGRIGNVSYFGDAWTWDGKAWARIDRNPTPAGRDNAAIVWNPNDSSLLVYGGLGIRPGAGPGNLGLPLADGWSLKAGAWSRIQVTGPPAIANADAIWNQQAGSAIVMFGMACPNPTNAAWSWNGRQWDRSTIGVAARWGAAVAQDDKGNVLVFGGSDEAGC